MFVFMPAQASLDQIHHCYNYFQGNKNKTSSLFGGCKFLLTTNWFAVPPAGHDLRNKFTYPSAACLGETYFSKMLDDINA